MVQFKNDGTFFFFLSWFSLRRAFFFLLSFDGQFDRLPVVETVVGLREQKKTVKFGKKAAESNSEPTRICSCRKKPKKYEQRRRLEVPSEAPSSESCDARRNSKATPPPSNDEPIESAHKCTVDPEEDSYTSCPKKEMAAKSPSNATGVKGISGTRARQLRTRFRLEFQSSLIPAVELDTAPSLPTYIGSQLRLIAFSCAWAHPLRS